MALLLLSGITGLVADPLFRSIGPAEIAYMLLMAAPFLATLALNQPVGRRRDSMVPLLIAFYCAIMLLSSVGGSRASMNGGVIFRSIAPLLVPLLSWLITMPSTSIPVLRLGFYSFVVAGVAQAFFIYYLYFTNVSIAAAESDIVARVTYFDLRPMQPFLLVALAFGAANMFRSKSLFRLLLGIGVFAIAFLGVIFTQTRTFILISAMLMVVAPILISASPKIPRALKRAILVRIGIVLGLAVAAVVTILLIGPPAGLLSSISGRFSGALDRNDWQIALDSMDLDSISGVLLGIGVGSTIDYYGQSVSYVHNGLIYHLVFMGLLGLVAYCAMLIYIGVRLTRAFVNSGSGLLLGVTLSYYAMVAYTLTFAVYKWPTFNVMFGFFALLAATINWSDVSARAPALGRSARQRVRAAYGVAQQRMATVTRPSSLSDVRGRPDGVGDRGA